MCVIFSDAKQMEHYKLTVIIIIFVASRSVVVTWDIHLTDEFKIFKHSNFLINDLMKNEIAIFFLIRDEE